MHERIVILHYCDKLLKSLDSKTCMALKYHATLNSVSGLLNRNSMIFRDGEQIQLKRNLGHLAAYIKVLNYINYRNQDPVKEYELLLCAETVSIYT